MAEPVMRSSYCWAVHGSPASGAVCPAAAGAFEAMVHDLRELLGTDLVAHRLPALGLGSIL